jgi:hypothetical protein
MGGFYRYVGHKRSGEIVTALIAKFTLWAVEISAFRAGEVKLMTTFVAKPGRCAILKLTSGASHVYALHRNVERSEIP